MSEMFDNQSSTIVLADQYGKECPFEFLDLIEYQGDRYAVLMALEEATEQFLVMRVKDAGGDMVNYVAVEDPVTVNAVLRLFVERYSQDDHKPAQEVELPEMPDHEPSVEDRLHWLNEEFSRTMLEFNKVSQKLNRLSEEIQKLCATC